MALLGFYISVLETEQERKRMSDIYVAYQRTCLYVAKSFLEDDEFLAEDVVHNTFINLIRNKELLDLPDNKLKALLLAIIKKRSIDLFRQKTRNSTENLDDYQSMPSPEESVEVQIATSEDFERLTSSLTCLNESYRSILQLKYFAELSNTKIGEYLGITNRQVETQLYKAKLMLRKAYYEDNFDDNAEAAINARKRG
ncbi:MAG: sigma-70 family RNA polymerase sigma factor [Oscillospiraceae bacterium]|nr:sigma-70 family RNA polymerase sigma factor [Oscillospiraceae bacterium]